MNNCVLLLAVFAFALCAAGCHVGPPEPDVSKASAAPDTSERPAPLSAASDSRSAPDEKAEICIRVNGAPVSVLWEDNPSVDALRALLRQGEITIETRRYGGFEQVGGLPKALVRNDAQLTAAAGDIMLYGGDSIVLFYGSNSWSYTRLGRIEALSSSEIEKLLGGDQATVELTLAQ